jgi:hypothetical protein
MYGRTGIAELLIAKGADVEAKDKVRGKCLGGWYNPYGMLVVSPWPHVDAVVLVFLCTGF